jgi:hypothetical protein
MNAISINDTGFYCERCNVEQIDFELIIQDSHILVCGKYGCTIACAKHGAGSVKRVESGSSNSAAIMSGL